MAVQPYDDCPCGSGKKFRWCCQKAAKFGDRAEQMLEKGQIAGALQTINEGLAAEPGNMWLRLLKVRILLETHDHDGARPLLEDILSASPGNRDALLLRLQDEVHHGALDAAMNTIQDLLDAQTGADETAAVVLSIGKACGDSGLIFTALTLLRLADLISESLREATEQVSGPLERQAEVYPWLRDTWQLRPAPPGISGGRERWANAVSLSLKGRWRCALALFDGIASEQPDCVDVWFNVAICQAWLQRPEAGTSLERYAKLDKDSNVAVHALALAQCIERTPSAQNVDVVEVRYVIRDHSRLIQRLKDHPRFQVSVLDAKEGELGPGVKDEFFLLDKNKLTDANSVTRETIEKIPNIFGRVQTAGGQLLLEFADPRPEDDRQAVTVEAAGDTIDPDGNRSVVGQVPVSRYRLGSRKALPVNTSPVAARQINQWVHELENRDTWLNTPIGNLESKTPLEAARVPELRLPLRAAVLIEEYVSDALFFDGDKFDLRAPLGMEPEPAIDGAQADIDHLPIAVLGRVRVDAMTTPQLVSLFHRAIQFGMIRAIEHSAGALAGRLQDREQFQPELVFHTLIDCARTRMDRAQSERWIAEARRFYSEIGDNSRDYLWDISEWDNSMRFDPVHVWVPRLTALLKKCSTGDASSALMLHLVRVGILRLVQDPSNPERAMIDGRILEGLVARYGSQEGSMLDLTTVSGGQPGKIWTPGSENAVTDSPIVLPGQMPSDKPRQKLVIPS
jgi:tetratricopeptide (TPR) repeat protein